MPGGYFSSDNYNALGNVAISISPDPAAWGTYLATLTGNVTVNAPATGQPGQTLLFVFTQDTTGGRAVSWNSVYRVSWQPSTFANARNTILFVYDGTNWNQVPGVGL